MQKDLAKKDPTTALQVKKILGAIKKAAPGNAVELRIPRYGAIQCVAGVNHRRGTPANVVEMEAETLFLLARTPDKWTELCLNGQIRASGHVSDLSKIFIELSRLKVEFKEQVNDN
jgi:hypothetical protein